MATQVNGRVKLAQGDYDTYDNWRSYALSHGINFDGWYGNQCWDLPALLWWQYGLNLITNPAGNGHAYQCWTVSRNTNAKGPFIAIDGVENIKRGDCLVFNKSSFSSSGHICFADTDYSARYYRNGVWRINCLGQNQGQYNYNNMGMNYQDDYDNRLAKLERQINRLDARITKLENANKIFTEESSSSMYMV